MKRRDFLAAGAAGLSALAAPTSGAVAAQPDGDLSDRAYMVDLLSRIAPPVLDAMSKAQLRKRFVPELSPSWDGRNRDVAYLECFGRLISGMAPWLALPSDGGAEGRLRERFRDQALASLAHSVDPASPDYLLWRAEGQPLVDSAFYVNAFLRAPRALWDPLDRTTRARIVREIQGLRRVSPPYSNWLLFTATNEAFLLSVGEQWDPLRVALAIRKLEEWYVGDGWYSDGPQFHFDYYNGFVIHPMLVGVIEALAAAKVSLPGFSPPELLDRAMKRMQRFGEHLERMIGPDGAFPPIGRSATYRTAAFQPLGLLALRKRLSESLPEGQVRAALNAAQRRIFAEPSNFDGNGYLTIGFAGHQPALGDSYSNSGSMYIVSESFLPLGLPPEDSYWTAPPLPWTMKRAYANAPFRKDYHVDY